MHSCVIGMNTLESGRILLNLWRYLIQANLSLHKLLLCLQTDKFAAILSPFTWFRHCCKRAPQGKVPRFSANLRNKQLRYIRYRRTNLIWFWAGRSWPMIRRSLFDGLGCLICGYGVINRRLYWVSFFIDSISNFLSSFDGSMSAFFPFWIYFFSL